MGVLVGTLAPPATGAKDFRTYGATDDDRREAIYSFAGPTPKALSLKPEHLYDDLRKGHTAADGTFPQRVLVVDDLRQGLFHAGEVAERPHQYRHTRTS
jgi:hypothetical protein